MEKRRREPGVTVWHCEGRAASQPSRRWGMLSSIAHGEGCTSGTRGWKTGKRAPRIFHL